MKTASGSTRLLAVSTLVLWFPSWGWLRAQACERPIASGELSATDVPPEVQQAEVTVERPRALPAGRRRWCGLDPELLMFGAHGTFGPLFNRNVDIRPGIEFGLGEVTTMFGINVDVLYVLPGVARGARWTPYVGAGPNFALSHRGFDFDEECGRRCGRRESLRLQ